MTLEKRTLAECNFRRGTPESEVAACGLLAEATGLKEVRLCEVSRDACEACSQSFKPSVDDPNPVVASLLYQLADKIIQRGGVHGCDVDKAGQLREWAEMCIPVVRGGDDQSAVTAIPDYSRPPRQGPLGELLPLPDQRCGSNVCHWAVGVTTAPRRLSTLEDCLESLVFAGWQSPRLFIDSAVTIADRHAHLATTLREPRVGAWPNYYLSLAELVMREPDANAYLMVQDDALFYNDPGFRDYLENALWPDDEPCLVSLYCSRNYTQPKAGWHRLNGNWTWGAVAFVFSREAAQRFLGDESVVLHRWNQAYEGMWGIDVLIGHWAARAGIPVWFPTPSMVQHIGHVSTLWRKSRALGLRRADSFPGDM